MTTIGMSRPPIARSRYRTAKEQRTLLKIKQDLEKPELVRDIH